LNRHSHKLVLKGRLARSALTNTHRALHDIARRKCVLKRSINIVEKLSKLPSRKVRILLRRKCFFFFFFSLRLTSSFDGQRRPAEPAQLEAVHTSAVVEQIVVEGTPAASVAAASSAAALAAQTAGLC
jgi:hypothetical protein